MPRILASLLVALVALGCVPKPADVSTGAEERSSASIGDVRTVAYDERTELRPGETLEVKKTNSAFTFVRVVSDSRCPKGLDCIRAGEAKFLVTLPGGGSQTVEVPADGRQPVRFGIPDGTVTVHSLNPYPVARQQTEPGAYRLVVTVAKAATM